MVYMNPAPLNYGNNVPLDYNQEIPHYNMQEPIAAPQITNGNIAIYENQPANIEMQEPYYPAQYYPDTYYVNKKGSPLLTGTIAGAAAGGIAALATYKNSSSLTKDGKIKDSFVKDVYNHYVNNYSPEDAKIQQQRVDILKKIEKINSKAELQKLADSNKEVFKSICESTFHKAPDVYIESLNENNIKNTVNIIKERVQNDVNNNYNLMKDNITNCLDTKTKKYVKAPNVSDDVFKSIEKCSKNTMKIVRNSAIAAVATGVAAGLIHKFARHE